jgi:NTP pyrophosphatase (non-canonical NTP hydrolase)
MVKMDSETTIQQLKEMVEKFVQDRNWAEFHDPKNLSMALAIEAAELMEIFQWKANCKSIEAMNKEDTSNAARDELADIITYAFAFANRNNIDISSAINQKIIKNQEKYPIDKYKWQATK